MVDTSEWFQDHYDAVLWLDVFDAAKGSKTRDMLATCSRRSRCT